MELRKGERLWEIDFLRGVAVCMMIVSNIVFDLHLFNYILAPLNLFWLNFAKTTASLFLFLVGVSLTLSYSLHPEPTSFGRKVFFRGCRIFCIGLLVSLVTWFAVGPNLVVFGILHLIGVGVILAAPFVLWQNVSLIVGVIVLAAGFWTVRCEVDYPWLIWLGLQYRGFSSVDYTPIVPWFGIILLGVFSGNIFFPQGKRRLAVPDCSGLMVIRLVEKIGQHSLIIYLTHQPIVFLFFLVVNLTMINMN